MTQFAFPYQIGADGRTRDAQLHGHIRALIELVLFTNQGERVNRPEFGANVPQLVFAENSPELSTAMQHLVLSALQRWLADRIEVRAVDVNANDATLSVLVRYRTLDSDEDRTVRVVRES